MHRLIISLSFSLGFSITSLHASLTTNEILTRLQNCIEENRPTTEIEEGLIDLSNKELSLLLKEYDKTWPKLREAYYKSFQKHAQSLYSGDAKLTRKRSIKNYREQFRSVYILGEGAMKKKLRSISMPALQLAVGKASGEQALAAGQGLFGAIGLIVAATASLGSGLLYQLYGGPTVWAVVVICMFTCLGYAYWRGRTLSLLNP